MDKKWLVRDDENNHINTVDGCDKYAAQDAAQAAHPGVLGLWIEELTLKESEA